MSLELDTATLEEKRKVEFAFFLGVLKGMGDQGLRPHQALACLNNMIPEAHRDDDKFYWEGVFGQKFSWEKPDNLPEGMEFCTLYDEEK